MIKSDDKLKHDFKSILDAVGYEISVNDYEKLDIENKPSRKTLAKRFGDKSWDELKEMISGKPLNNKKATELKQEFDKNSAYITTKSINIKTVEDALAYAKVDCNIWQVEKYLINSWEVTMGYKATKGKPETYTNWQVKVWLKRKIVNIDKLADIFKGLVSSYVPNYKIVPKWKSLDKVLCEISIYDLHFGKKSWEKETGENYDTEIAEKRFINAVDDLAQKASIYRPERILFPIGNDFLHIDTLSGTTTKGTRQDADDRTTMLFKNGLLLLVKSIDKLSTIAPVNVIIVPGNHDTMSMFHLGTALWSWYRNIKHISVDDSFMLRKYFEYGNSLIGFVHGDRDDAPVKNLPLIMAQEQSEAWARTKFREWHIGHVHKRKETDFIAGDTYNGVHVKVIPSLTGTDAWHYQHGYVKGERMAESFLWDFKNGCIGTFKSYVKNED
jgi:hypothetical protein